jgi:hypothetical protein
VVGARTQAAVAGEIARRLTSDGDALSSTIAAAGMRRVMLEAVACGMTQTPADIKRYIKCTLLNALNDFQDVARLSTFNRNPLENIICRCDPVHTGKESTPLLTNLRFILLASQCCAVD